MVGWQGSFLVQLDEISRSQIAFVIFTFLLCRATLSLVSWGLSVSTFSIISILRIKQLLIFFLLGLVFYRPIDYFLSCGHFIKQHLDGLTWGIKSGEWQNDGDFSRRLRIRVVHVWMNIQKQILTQTHRRASGLAKWREPFAAPLTTSPPRSCEERIMVIRRGLRLITNVVNVIILY